MREVYVDACTELLISAFVISDLKDLQDREREVFVQEKGDENCGKEGEENPRETREKRGPRALPARPRDRRIL